jgi:hypothetical protein
MASNPIANNTSSKVNPCSPLGCFIDLSMAGR